MRIIIRGKNVELSEDMQKYISEKINGLEKFDRSINYTSSVATIEVGLETRHHKSGKIYHTEVNITAPKMFLRAEAEAEDIYQSIDIARSKLEENISSHKKSMATKRHRAALIWKKIKSISPLAWLKNEFRKGKRDKEKF